MNWKKLIPAIIIFLLGAVFSIFGGLFKILHWGLGPVNPGLLLAIGAVVKVIAIFVAIVALLSMRKQDN